MGDELRTFLADFLDWLNGQEAGLVKMRLQVQKVLGEAKPSAELPFNASRIKWQDRENEKGPFQLSEDYDSADHKALLKFLEDHSPGKYVNSEGWFYWIYPNGSTIDRRQRNQKGETKA